MTSHDSTPRELQARGSLPPEAQAGLAGETAPAREHVHVLGAMALELRAGSPVERACLNQEESGKLIGLVARDLARLAPEAEQLQLVSVGAHYDPVELLRPNWALHRELFELAARAPGETAGRVIAFGAHEGLLPGNLNPSPDLFGGPMRLVPFVLSGEADIINRIGEMFETELIERGMVGTETGLNALAYFGMQIEHARYMTVHDLAAMLVVQYEHVGLAALWQLLWTALQAPESEDWLDAPPEPLIHYTQGVARIGEFELEGWQRHYQPDAPGGTPEERQKLERQFKFFQARQRQIAAVLGVHGVTVAFVPCGGDDPRAALSA